MTESKQQKHQLQGWGHFELTAYQQPNFQQFMKDACYVKYRHYPEYEPQCYSFAQLLPTFFPGFPYQEGFNHVTSMHNERELFEPNHHAESGHNVVISGRKKDLFSRAGNIADIDLQIYHPSHSSKEYYATLGVHLLYVPQVVDALAERLGQREQPPLSGLKSIYESEKSDRVHLGFPDANRLPILFRVYEEAIRLIDDVAPKISGMNETELNILLRDAYGLGRRPHHENVAVRRSSEHLYQDTLDQLCNL